MLGFGQCESRDFITFYTLTVDGGEGNESMVLFDLYKQGEQGYKSYLIYDNNDDFFYTKYEYLNKSKSYNHKKEYHNIKENLDAECCAFIDIDERKFNFKNPQDAYNFNILFSMCRFNKSALLCLKKFQNIDFKIMRNGIFARHGYRFVYGGEMYKYFINQDWYRPRHVDVSNFLTEIEKYNIQLLQNLEKTTR